MEMGSGGWGGSWQGLPAGKPVSWGGAGGATASTCAWGAGLKPDAADGVEMRLRRDGVDSEFGAWGSERTTGETPRLALGETPQPTVS